jgi:hypothetical protein
MFLRFNVTTCSRGYEPRHECIRGWDSTIKTSSVKEQDGVPETSGAQQVVGGIKSGQVIPIQAALTFASKTGSGYIIIAVTQILARPTTSHNPVEGTMKSRKLIPFIIGLFMFSFIREARLPMNQGDRSEELSSRSGALEALEFWSASRSYPSTDISPDKYYRAFLQVKREMRSAD